MIAPEPFFAPRGTPISIFQRLHGLSRLGYEVDLLTIHVGTDVKIPNVTIHRTYPFRQIENVPIGPSAVKIFLDVLLFFQALTMLVRRRYDAIHSHEEAAFYAMILGFLFRVPHIYDMHSSLPQQLRNFDYGRSKYNKPIFIKLFAFLERAVLKTCSVVLTVGVDLEEHVLSVNPNANQIRIENTAIHNVLQPGADAATRLRQRLGLDGRPLVVYTGNFERYQGLDLLFEGARVLVEEYPELAIVMVGGSEKMVDKWQRAAEEMQLSKHVVFVGTVPITEALEYLELATVLASPRTEGLSVPLKLYTYLYAGKPILATDIYAHTQVLSEETALIVEPTPAAYADGLRCLLQDEALCRRLGENARTFAQEALSMDTYLQKLEKAFTAARLSKPITEVGVLNTEAVSGEQIGSVLSSK